jgi:hypothetical protein
MTRFQIGAMIIGAIILMIVGVSIKHKQCQYMAPDHVTYCMLMTR